MERLGKGCDGCFDRATVQLLDDEDRRCSGWVAVQVFHYHRVLSFFPDVSPPPTVAPLFHPNFRSRSSPFLYRSAAGLRVSFVCSAGSCSTPAGPLMELDGRGKRQRSDSPELDPVSAVPATLLQHNASSNPSYKEAHLLRALALFLCQFRHLLRRIWSLHLSRRGRRPAQRGASSSMKTANAGSRFEVLATEDSMETGHPSNAQAKFTANNTFDFTLGSATHTKTPSQAGRRAAPTKKLSSSSASPMKSKNTQSSSGPRPQQGPRIQTNAAACLTAAFGRLQWMVDTLSLQQYNPLHLLRLGLDISYGS